MLIKAIIAGMKLRTSFLCCLVIYGASAALAQAPKIDWEKQKAETLKHYRSLIQIDTQNPPGNETKAVEYLKTVIEAEGIPTKTFAMDPNRANLVARLKGNGSKRPLLILAHTDVVGVQREKWPVDPFGAVIKDRYVWGRGSKDDKPVLAANLITMLMLKRLGVQLDRDVIFLAESGEEADVTGVGINYMVREHFAEIDAEFAMTEGGGATIDGGRVARFEICGHRSEIPAGTFAWRIFHATHVGRANDAQRGRGGKCDSLRSRSYTGYPSAAG